MRKLGIALMWIGFLAAAFYSMRLLGTVEWVPYAIFAAIAATGVVLIRRTDSAGATDVVKVTEDLATLESRLATANERLTHLLDRRESVDVYEVRHEVDEHLADPLEEFADARESMIHGLGMDEYASIMDHFARGERFVHRAWSASADGYIDEVWKSLDLAAENLRLADEELRQAMDATRARA